MQGEGDRKNKRKTERSGVLNKNIDEKIENVSTLSIRWCHCATSCIIVSPGEASSDKPIRNQKVAGSCMSLLPRMTT